MKFWGKKKTLAQIPKLLATTKWLSFFVIENFATFFIGKDIFLSLN